MPHRVLSGALPPALTSSVRGDRPREHSRGTPVRDWYTPRDRVHRGTGPRNSWGLEVAVAGSYSEGTVPFPLVVTLVVLVEVKQQLYFISTIQSGQHFQADNPRA